MPVRAKTPTGAPCWVDLTTSDVDRARTFYAEVFGWVAGDADPEFGGYFMFTRNGVPVAGCMARMPDSQMPDAWSVYLTTDDAAKTVAAATDHGGQVIVPPMPVGDLGTMGYLVDAGGAAVGFWQPEAFAGFGLIAESGAPGWFELRTRDYEAAVAFYRQVFGWDTQVMSDDPQFRYTVMAQGDDQYAGIMDASAFLPAEVPAHWAVYLGVPDTDAALEQIVGLGGAVVRPAEDTPHGRLATAADPTGAVFCLVAPNEQMPAKS